MRTHDGASAGTTARGCRPTSTRGRRDALAGVLHVHVEVGHGRPARTFPRLLADQLLPPPSVVSVPPGGDRQPLLAGLSSLSGAPRRRRRRPLRRRATRPSAPRGGQVKKKRAP